MKNFKRSRRSPKFVVEFKPLLWSAVLTALFTTSGEFLLSSDAWTESLTILSTTSGESLLSSDDWPESLAILSETWKGYLLSLDALSGRQFLALFLENLVEELESKAIHCIFEFLRRLLQKFGKYCLPLIFRSFGAERSAVFFVTFEGRPKRRSNNFADATDDGPTNR